MTLFDFYPLYDDSDSSLGFLLASSLYASYAFSLTFFGLLSLSYDSALTLTLLLFSFFYDSLFFLGASASSLDSKFPLPVPLLYLLPLPMYPILPLPITLNLLLLMQVYLPSFTCNTWKTPFLFLSSIFGTLLVFYFWLLKLLIILHKIKFNSFGSYLGNLLEFSSFFSFCVFVIVDINLIILPIYFFVDIYRLVWLIFFHNHGL